MDIAKIAASANSPVIGILIQKYIEVASTNEPEEWGENALIWSSYHCDKLARIEARYRIALATAIIAESEKTSVK